MKPEGAIVEAPLLIEICMVPPHRLSDEIRASGKCVAVGRTADGRYFEVHGNEYRPLDMVVGALFMAMLRPSLLERLGVSLSQRMKS